MFVISEKRRRSSSNKWIETVVPGLFASYCKLCATVFLKRNYHFQQLCSPLRHLLPLMCQPEFYWLLKQRILLFGGWKKLNIKRVFCKQWISLQHQMSETNFEVIYQIRETVFMELFQENFYSFSFSKMQNRFWYTYKLILEFCPRKTEIVRYPIGFRPNFSSLVY